MTWPLKLNFHHQILSTLAVKKSFIYIIERPRYKGVLGQFVAGQFVADNSSRTIRRGQFVATYKIEFTESTASISATFFSSILLRLQQLSFHHSHFHFSYTFIMTPAFNSAIFVSSLSVTLLQH